MLLVPLLEYQPAQLLKPQLNAMDMAFSLTVKQSQILARKAWRHPIFISFNYHSFPFPLPVILCTVSTEREKTMNVK